MTLDSCIEKDSGNQAQGLCYYFYSA